MAGASRIMVVTLNYMIDVIIALGHAESPRRFLPEVVFFRKASGRVEGSVPATGLVWKLA